MQVLGRWWKRFPKEEGRGPEEDKQNGEAITVTLTTTDKTEGEDSKRKERETGSTVTGTHASE